MAPMFEQYGWVAVLFWFLMIPAAAWILVQVTHFFADEGPGTWRGAILAVLGVYGATYLAYELSGYVFVLMMQNPQTGFQLPPDFGLWQWLREPHAVKWSVLGFVPFLRGLPVVIALCVGGSLQFFLWSVPFRTGLTIFVTQLACTLAAMLGLSFVLSTGVALAQGTFERPDFFGRQADVASEPGQSRARPADLRRLSQRARETPPRPGWLQRANNGWASINGWLDPLYRFLQPATNHLPYPVQTVLNEGGWLLVFAGALAIAWRVRTKWKRRPVPASQARA
jgi:hypothetical protein